MYYVGLKDTCNHNLLSAVNVVFVALIDHDNLSGSCNVLHKCEFHWLRHMGEDRWSSRCFSRRN